MYLSVNEKHLSLQGQSDILLIKQEKVQNLSLLFTHTCYVIALAFTLQIKVKIHALSKVIWGMPTLKIQRSIPSYHRSGLISFGKINQLILCNLIVLFDFYNKILENTFSLGMMTGALSSLGVS